MPAARAAAKVWAAWKALVAAKLRAPVPGGGARLSSGDEGVSHGEGVGLQPLLVLEAHEQSGDTGGDGAGDAGALVHDPASAGLGGGDVVAGHGDAVAGELGAPVAQLEEDVALVGEGPSHQDVRRKGEAAAVLAVVVAGGYDDEDPVGRRLVDRSLQEALEIVGTGRALNPPVRFHNPCPQSSSRNRRRGPLVGRRPLLALQ
jgi:hypothetical protein